MREFHRPDEKIFLLSYELGDKDEFGYAKKTWIEAQELRGIIQRTQNIDISEKGVESNPFYTAYLCPDFFLKQNEINNYRIKYKKPHETLILKIDEYNPNLFQQHHQDHIQLTLVLEKKNG